MEPIAKRVPDVQISKLHDELVWNYSVESRAVVNKQSRLGRAQCRSNTLALSVDLFGV